MRDKLYERYYKLGLGNFIYKSLMGLKRPRKAVKRFYYLFMIVFVLVVKLIGI